jgi:hypothetical protein
MRRSPLVALAASFASLLLVGTSQGAPRLSEFGPYLVPSSGVDLGMARARRAAAGPDDPLAKVESGVLERAQVIGNATSLRQRRLALDASLEFSSPGIPVDERARIYLRIDGAGVAQRLGDLVGLGVEPAHVAGAYGFLEAWVPWDRVQAVAALPWVRLVGMAGIPSADIGSRLTEGDAIHRAAQARAAFNIDGTGAKVGVISDGAVSWAAAQATGDLPAALQINAVGSGDEGTAMLEIVHDLAPGAMLAFSSGNGGAAAMILSQNWLAQVANCRILADDLWFPREPYFQDGPVALNAANLVNTLDVVYFTSAGNRAQRHVQQGFVDGGSRAIGTAGTFRPHAFGPGDFTLDLRLSNPNGTGVRHTIVLQWGEAYAAAGRNFDLYLLDGTLSNVLQASTTVQNGAGDPVELIDFTYNGPDNVPAFLVVDFNSAAAAPAGMPLKIAANGPRFLQYVTAAGSINPHAGHPLVMALGAIDQADAGADSPEASSSRGPFTVLFPAAASRGKPDAMGIDGVSVTGVGGFPTPFFGTSAAAPHGAGIAALLRGALPALTALQVRDALKVTAVDLLPAGFDNTSGAGRLDALNALGLYLNNPPVADAGNDTTAECKGALTQVQLDGSRSYDADGDALTYAWSAAGIAFDDPTAVKPTGGFPLGATNVLLVVFDGAAADSDTVVVTVADTTPPVVTVTLDPNVLWPPNHRLAEITATVTAVDTCDGSLDIRLVSIASDEADDGLGDGDTADDIQGATFGADDRSFLLRSERDGGREGRTYTVCYEAEDGSGNVGTGCATVQVTHDQSLLASFGANADGSSPWDKGGWIELTTAGTLDPVELANASPELGGASFTRLVLEAEDPLVGSKVDPSSGSVAATGGAVSSTAEGASRVRWFVSAKQLRLLLEGSGDATISARIETEEGSWLAQALVPGVPAGALAPPTIGTDATRAAPVALADDALPARLEVRGGIARPSGGIVFALPGAGRMTLRLVSPSGRVLARLVDTVLPAGWHTATLPAAIAPGLYFLDAQAGGARAHAKVLIAR